ncbi:MAG TPA: serine kinase [Devosia sp.]|nr:serine kinase [Devosia sp.]
MMMANVGGLPTNIHATGLLYRGRGLLLRGAPGAGKSFLALSLLEKGEGEDPPACLVGDDRIDLSRRHGCLYMQGPAVLAGKIELFGRGILSRPFMQGAPVDLVVDLLDTPTRMPEAGEWETRILDVPVSRCPVPVFPLVSTAHQMMLIAAALADFPGHPPAGTGSP